MQLFHFIICLLASLSWSTSIKIDYVTSAMVRTDPILNQNGLSGHVHTFFGASIADPSTTYEDLRNPNTGNSGNVIENKSLYWYPTIYRYDETQEKYFVADIFHHSSYYIWNTGEATAFPDGFKMIIHATDSCEIERDMGNIFHRCGRATAECVQPGQCPNGDCSVLNGFFPPQSCIELEMSIELPSCWDGVSLDSADHRSHVSYGRDNEACPSSHPVRIPKIFVFTRIMNYPGGKHLFSDGTGIFHTDYFSGWRQSELQYVLDNCRTDSQHPAPDSFCDNGRGGWQNGFENNNPRFLNYLDAPKFVSMEQHETQIGFDVDVSDKLSLVTPQIDTSHITTEEIDGVRFLPGSRPTDSDQISTSTTTSQMTTTTLRPTTTSTTLIPTTTTSATACFDDEDQLLSQSSGQLTSCIDGANEGYCLTDPAEAPAGWFRNLCCATCANSATTSTITPDPFACDLDPIGDSFVEVISNTEDVLNGCKRRFFVKTPPQWQPEERYAVIFVFHGLGGSAGSEQDWAYETDARGVILVLPQGIDGAWNGGTCCGAASNSASQNDVVFFEDMVSILTTTYNADASRIYGYGTSNGGWLMHRIACESDKLRKGVDFIGSHGQKNIYDDLGDYPPCAKTIRPPTEDDEEPLLHWDESLPGCSYEDWKVMPDHYTCDVFQTNKPDLMMIHGKDDVVVLYEGDAVINAPQSYGRRYYAELAGCDYEAMTVSQQWGPDDLCFTDTSCNTNLTYCDSAGGHGSAFMYNPIEVAVEFFCQDQGCASGNPITTTGRPSSTTRLPTTTTNSNSGNTEWCPDSAEQLCRMQCPDPTCSEGQCALRDGACCDYTCIENPSGLQYFIDDQGCPNDASYISDEENCEEAAAALDFGEIRKSFSNSRKLRGCYVKRNRVYFNRATSSTNANGRQSLCMTPGTTNVEDDSNDVEEDSTDIERSLYFQSESGSCPAGYDYITNENVCESAGQALEISDELEKIFRSRRRVRGCYTKNGNVFFNRDTRYTNQSNSAQRKSICVQSNRRGRLLKTQTF